MKKTLSKLFLVSTGILIGIVIWHYKYKLELKRITSKIKGILRNENYSTFETLVDKLQKKLTEKEKIVNEFKVDIERMEKKLSNLEGQYSELINSLIKQTEAQQKELAHLKSGMENEIGEEKKSAQKLIEEINTTIENKDVITAIKLLKKLVMYGKEYYQVVFDVIKKISEVVAGKRGFNVFNTYINGVTYFRELTSSEFINFYKWVIENPAVAKEDKIVTIERLVWAGGDEVKPYLFEQFKKQDDIEVKGKLFQILSDCSEYKNSFIHIAKDMSQDINLRRKIVSEYKNDDFQEVTALFNFLKTNEQDEQIKSIIEAREKRKSSGE